MIRVIAITTLLCAGSLRAPGQSGFITQFNDQQVGLSGYGHSVREVADGYLVFGHQVSADPLGRTHCVIFKVDQQGQFEWRNELQVGENNDYNFGLFDPVSVLDTGGFGCAVVRFNGTAQGEIRLLRMNIEGDTVGSQVCAVPVIESPFGVRYGPRQTRQTSDGGFIVTGVRTQNGSGDSISPVNRGLLLRLGGTGDTLWVRTYGAEDATVSGYSVAEVPGGGIFLAGSFLDGGNMNLCLLISTDDNGNELWRRRFGGRSFNEAQVRARPNGHAVTFSSYGEVGWPLSRYQYLLREWDENGDTIWQTRSHYGQITYPGDLELLEDGSIITVGESIGLAQLAKFSPTGDSLWTRQYECTNSEHYSYDVQLASDGGFIATGYAHQGANDPSPGVEVIWILKTDSLGCVVPGCQNVGVQEYAMDLQEHLRVSPNPASEVVNMELDLPEGVVLDGQVQVHLQDATGRLVLQKAVLQQFNSLRATMDVSALSSGIYYLHFRDARRWLAGSKLVVE